MFSCIFSVVELVETTEEMQLKKILTKFAIITKAFDFMLMGYMYILKCADDSYYVGSTKDLGLRVAQHKAGEGANHTKKRLPVELVYYEEYQRIDEVFY